MISRLLLVVFSALLLTLACMDLPADPAGGSEVLAAEEQVENRRLLGDFLGVAIPAAPRIEACPGPGPGPAQGLGAGVGNFPCTLTTECQPGLTCNYGADQSPTAWLPWGKGCGLCQSDLGQCPPIAPWWGHCGGPGEPGCPPYVSMGVQGRGCTWPRDCASGACDYGKPTVGFCGSCQ